MVEVETVANNFTGTKPAALMRSSWFASAQTLSAVKKPLSSVLARALYGVSDRATLAPAIGTLLEV